MNRRSFMSRVVGGIVAAAMACRLAKENALPSLPKDIESEPDPIAIYWEDSRVLSVVAGSDTQAGALVFYGLDGRVYPGFTCAKTIGSALNDAAAGEVIQIQIS